MTRAVRNLIVLGVLAVLAMPTFALASAEQVLRDCIRDGTLDREYSNEELRKAKDNLPADSDEYSDCSDVIASAIKGGSDNDRLIGGAGKDFLNGGPGRDTCIGNGGRDRFKGCEKIND